MGRKSGPALYAVAVEGPFAIVVWVRRPRREFRFFYDSLDDLAEPVTVTYRGNPSSLIRGDWRMTLQP